MAGEETGNFLVFTGSMDWLPNEDAIFYFVESILPLIKLQCPDVSLKWSAAAHRANSSIGQDGEKHSPNRLGQRHSTIRGARRRVHRSAAHWRRHSPQDLRSHGDGQGCRFNVGGS